MKRQNTTFLPVGGASLLVIFASLCLTVFALLSISTAQAEVRLGEKSRAAVTDYYLADARAEELLACLRRGEIPEEVTVQDGYYTYICPISDSQGLSVAVAIQEDDYQILRWQVISTTQWVPDDRLPVWTGPQEQEG